MNAFTFLNVALHSLLLSTLGWLAVRWFLRDARHRAWAVLLTLIVATLAPLAMNWPHEAAPKMEKNETSTATTWTPDWKVNVSTLQTSSSAQLKRPADVSGSSNQTWRLEDLASGLCVLAFIGSVVALLWHGSQTFRGIALLRSLKLKLADV